MGHTGRATLRRLWLLKRGNRNPEGDNFVVTYEDEDGYDDGGLTAEMFRTALEQAFRLPSFKLFDCPEGGTALPAGGASNSRHARQATTTSTTSSSRSSAPFA